MEVTVLEAKNAPRKPVIAMRAGSSLRHAELALNEPFHMPMKGVQDGSMKVSLYQTLGTQTIKDADEAESVCDVPVRTPDGKCSQVKLRIRRDLPCTGPNFKSSSKGVENYLEAHQLEARIQSLFELVLKKQPRCPYRCMIEELQKIKRSGSEDTNAIADAPGAAPKAPVAPSEPAPKNARPSPAGKGRNVKAGGSGGAAASEGDVAMRKAMSEVRASQAAVPTLGNADPRAREKEGNRECAQQIMRIVFRGAVAKMAKESSSLGSQRVDGRARAIEHAINTKVSHYVSVMVMQAAHTRLQARSLGILDGGRSKSDDIVCVRDKEATLAFSQTRSLTTTVVNGVIKTASIKEFL